MPITHDEPCEYLSVDDDLQLRALVPEDAQHMFNLTVSNRAYLAEFLPWAAKVTTVDDSLAFIENTKLERAAGNAFGFGIIALGELVGHISLMHLTDEKAPEIGYWITQSASGRGLTTKAARAISDFGFNELGLDEILIRARPDNAGSNKIAQKLGYQHEGEQTDEDGVLHNHWIGHKS